MSMVSLEKNQNKSKRPQDSPCPEPPQGATPLLPLHTQCVHHSPIFSVMPGTPPTRPISSQPAFRQPVRSLSMFKDKCLHLFALGREKEPACPWFSKWTMTPTWQRAGFAALPVLSKGKSVKHSSAWRRGGLKVLESPLPRLKDAQVKSCSLS